GRHLVPEPAPPRLDRHDRRPLDRRRPPRARRHPARRFRVPRSKLRRLLLLAVLLPAAARADVTRDRFSAAGYFRVMMRPDLDGGANKLGFSGLHGPLLHHGPRAPPA